jgi:hypothetical protein
MPIGSFCSHREEVVNTYAARNLTIGAFRRTGSVGIAHACRYYGRDDQRILARYGYT